MVEKCWSKSFTSKAILIPIGVLIVFYLALAQANADVTQEIIMRCRTQMQEYGSAMVKACVDQDIAALRALNGYPTEHQAIVSRCYRQMKDYGYAMVKACADQDIQAEEALKTY
jgi:hypothetical protein